MRSDDDSDEKLETTTDDKRETLAHLVPRVVVRAPFYAKQLGPVRDVAVREGCVAVIFDGGIELRFHGDGELWSALLAKVHAGELVVAGDVEDQWKAVAAEVARVRTPQ